MTDSTTKTITKKALVDQIAQSTGQKRSATKQIVQEFLNQVIAEIAQGNRLEFRDFGVFEVKHRAPRIAQNPKTLERVPVPAKRTVKFKAGRLMRESLEKNTPTQSPQQPFNEQSIKHQRDTQPTVHVSKGNTPAIAGSLARQEAIATS